MASGFSGGGGPDFYAGISGRSIANMNAANNPSQSSYRSQLSQMFLDPSSHQIAKHRAATASLTPPAGLMGKRTLAEFQAHQQQQPNLNPLLNSLLLRSVKPRMYQHTSPNSTLSPIEFSANMSSHEVSALSQRCGVPLLQQLRPQPTNLGAGPTFHSTNQTLPGIPCMNALQNQNRKESERMMNRIQELEKHLLDDNDVEEGDAVSVITNTNSEWSETIQNLIGCSSPKPIAPSPTSSSSSSSTSVTTLAPSCSKQTVLDAASAISEGKSDFAAEILTRISQASNPRGTSEQRLMEYMLIALKSRANYVENPPSVAEMYSKEHFGSTQLLYELCPCFKLGFMAANLAIVEATLDQQPNSCGRFHVLDFDIGQGGQYINLLYLLSECQTGKPAIKVKITAVAENGGDEKERLKMVGEMLSQLAGRVGVSLDFNVVVCYKLGDLSRDSLGCEHDEPLAVNFAFKLYKMPDESVSIENPRDELLRRVKKLAPRVVTIVEREMNTNTAPFAARVNEACAYYGALFESIESTVQQRDSAERLRVEEALGRMLANSVACEGRDRLERCEVFGKWRARMAMAGFELKPLSPKIAESAKDRLSSPNRVSPGFTVKQENGVVCLGWMGKTLTVASAWR
uniref:GRAS15 protein n=1 Tax=Rhizophora mucronata TaxID=61149 RepID=A0A2P2JZT0_RHIMU